MVVILLFSPLTVNGTYDTQKPSSPSYCQPPPSCPNRRVYHHKKYTAPTSSAAKAFGRKLNNDLSSSFSTKTNNSGKTSGANNIPNNNKNFVRHITRVNISDVYSQIECNDGGGVEPITKEGKSKN